MSAANDRFPPFVTALDFKRIRFRGCGESPVCPQLSHSPAGFHHFPANGRFGKIRDCFCTRREWQQSALHVEIRLVQHWSLRARSRTLTLLVWAIYSSDNKSSIAQFLTQYSNLCTNATTNKSIHPNFFPHKRTS